MVDSMLPHIHNVALSNLVSALEFVLAIPLLLGVVYEASLLDEKFGKRFGWLARILPSIVGAGAFGAAIAVLPSYTTNPWWLGILGALSSIFGLYAPRSLSEHLSVESVLRLSQMLLVGLFIWIFVHLVLDSIFLP